MSELQNNAVALLNKLEAGTPDVSIPYRRKRLLQQAFQLHRSLGGRTTEIETVVADLLKAPVERIDEAVAFLMIESAAVRYASDIDMVQATYNKLDHGLRRGA